MRVSSSGDICHCTFSYFLCDGPDGAILLAGIDLQLVKCAMAMVFRSGLMPSLADGKLQKLPNLDVRRRRPSEQDAAVDG